MDPTILVSLIGLAGILGGGLIGWFAKVTVAAISKPAPEEWNGKNRRAFQAAIDAHIILCPNMKRIEDAMKDGLAELKAEIRALGSLLETHRNQAH